MLWAGALVLAMIAGGCGGGGDDTPLTKAQFVKQADSICAQAQKEKEDILAKSAKDAAAASKDVSPAKRQEELILSLLDPFEVMTDDLSELVPPAGDEAQVEKMIASFDSAVTELKEDPRKAVGSSPFAKPDQMAQAYGLSSCSAI